MFRWSFAIFALLLGMVGALPSASAVVLFDGNVGLPATQGWSKVTIGNEGTEGVAGGVYTLDSTGAGVDTWGRARFSPVSLDTVNGFSIDFTLRVISETHSRADRAGFSLLFVGADATKSLELAFWSTEVFAYEFVTGAFVHGVGAALDTSAAMRTYTLQVANQQYTLSLQGDVLFAGSLQNYTPQGLPYTLPGFMFFGDNTSSGAARVEMTSVLLAAVPEAQTSWLWLAGLAVLFWRARFLRRAAPRRQDDA